jgi:hypothetical protein
MEQGAVRETQRTKREDAFDCPLLELTAPRLVHILSRPSYGITST